MVSKVRNVRLGVFSGGGCHLGRRSTYFSRSMQSCAKGLRILLKVVVMSIGLGLVSSLKSFQEARKTDIM